MEEKEFFHVLSDGETKQVTEFGMEDSLVYIIIDNEKRNIFMWKGPSAGVRLKFIGSRAMGEKRKQLGFHYQIHTEDAGDESQLFRSTILGEGQYVEPSKKKRYENDPEAPPDLEALAREQGIDLDSLEYETQDPYGASPISNMGLPGMRPQRSILTEMDRLQGDKEIEPLKTDVPRTQRKSPQKKKVDTVSIDSYFKKRLENGLSLLKELGNPKGYTREMIVLNNKVYRVDPNGYDLEDFDTPLEGIFDVNEYVPRLICESDEVILIELLKPTGEEMDEEMTQSLSDLTSMFMIEIE